MTGLVEYQPALVEAAVLVAVRARREERALLRERDPLYAIADGEARDTAFGRLYARWFERLALHRPLEKALAERPAIAASCARRVVARVVDRRDEAADLLGSTAAGPVLLVRMTADTLGAPERTLTFLRRELLHVADMLDPAFGYPTRHGRPDAAHAGGAELGPRVREAAGNGWPPAVAVRDRYGVLWATTVDGRLARAGQAPATARSDRWRDFQRAFPGLGETAFEPFWRAEPCTHTDLLAFARGGAGAGRLCPLCGFPSGGAAPGPLPPSVLAAIAADFPSWRPEAGVCARCAEIYAVAHRQ